MDVLQAFHSDGMGLGGWVFFELSREPRRVLSHPYPETMPLDAQYLDKGSKRLWTGTFLVFYDGRSNINLNAVHAV